MERRLFLKLLGMAGAAHLISAPILARVEAAVRALPEDTKLPEGDFWLRIGGVDVGPYIVSIEQWTDPVEVTRMEDRERRYIPGPMFIRADLVGLGDDRQEALRKVWEESPKTTIGYGHRPSGWSCRREAYFSKMAHHWPADDLVRIEVELQLVEDPRGGKL